MTHPHKALGNHVEQEAADKFMGLEGHGLFAVPVTKADFSAMGRNNPIVGQRHSVGVAAEEVRNVVGRAERFFGLDDPWFFS